MPVQELQGEAMKERPAHDSATCPCNKCCATRREERERPAGASAATPEPPPIRNGGTSVHDLVIKDIQARKVFGFTKYGTTLQAFNGRRAAMDAYQESLDLAAYFRQLLEEDNVLLNTVRELLDVIDMAGWTVDPRVQRAQELVNALTRRASAAGSGGSAT